jgi:hypothetical protein
MNEEKQANQDFPFVNPKGFYFLLLINPQCLNCRIYQYFFRLYSLMRTTDNNGGKSIDKFDNSNIADLSAIENRNLLDLQMENPDLLVFPHSFGQYNVN